MLKFLKAKILTFSIIKLARFSFKFLKFKRIDLLLCVEKMSDKKISYHFTPIVRKKPVTRN